MTIGTISIIAGVVLLALLKIFFKDEENLDQNKGVHGIDDNDFMEDPWSDPGWSTLSGNLFNKDGK